MTSEISDNDRDRATRLRRTAQTAPLSRVSDKERLAQWEGQSAAIYCRISHVDDDDQTGVDRQERICRDVADRLGLVVPPEQVFVDNNRSAWKRNRIRKGWDALLKAARNGTVKHIIAYHPDRLMRQPRDLEELLTISDDGSIMLHGQANRRDLSDADDRFFLRIEVAHACRSSDDASRRLQDAMLEQAQDGKPHGGRSFGYASGGVTIVKEEAKIIQEIFDRYLDGDSALTIALDFVERGVPGMTPKSKWSATRILRILDNRHLAGIRVFRGEEIGRGEWEPIIDEGRWAEVRERRTFRAAKHIKQSAPHRYYLLRGLVTCKRCGIRMSGQGGHYPTYTCNRASVLGEDRCVRRISAVKLEAFVLDAALNLLENLRISDDVPRTSLSDTAQEALDLELAELAELKDMWTARGCTTREYRQMRAVVEQRIAKIQTKAVIRPTATILKGLTGPNARTAWQQLSDEGDDDRQNAVLRFLFAAVIIDAASPERSGRFDYARIHIEPNPI